MPSLAAGIVNIASDSPDHSLFKDPFTDLDITTYCSPAASVHEYETLLFDILFNFL